jgi:uncharacterized repeat protein (TIGR03806 family)
VRTRTGGVVATVACCAWLAACHSSSGGDPPPTNPPGAPPTGLDARPSNTTCVAPAKAPGAAGTTIALRRVFANLTFSQPLLMLQAPGDDSRWYVLEKGSGPNATAATARVLVFANDANVAATSTALTLTVNASSEGGLLGMAFHPNYAANHQVFVSFTEGNPMVSHIARFTTTDGGATFGNRQDILSLDQPFDNHDGGNIVFGPDGFLYIGFGDGGSGGDPGGRAQDTTDMLGDLLRVDVDGGAPYAIPPDNPFASSGPICTANSNQANNDCPEIYAWGFRNPWRFSFDAVNGDLWVGDVGQGSFEEIDRVAKGRNYGWDCREGAAAYTGPPGGPAAVCSGVTGLVDPVHAYGRGDGSTVTGGYVYRGSALPALAGKYVFADYGSGNVWALSGNGATFTRETLLAASPGIASFAQDNDRELYAIDINNGRLYEIVDGNPAPGGSPVPAALSGTGCVVASSPSQPAPGLVPYDVAAPFWSDGAVKERWLAIPNGTSIAVGGDGDFTFPNGTVLMKHFRLNGALVETRLFMRHPDGDWAGYSYEWNAQQTDATLVSGGKTATVGGQSWIFPSGADCLQCHTPAAGFALGPESAQLNHDFLYPSTNRTANELRTLDHIVLFTTPLGDPAAQPSMPSPADTAAPLGARARAYLHTNCAQCHRAGGPTPVPLDLRYATLLSSTAACNAPPTAGDMGLGAAARIIAPGSPDASVLVARMAVDRSDASRMPPLASSLVDTAGVALIREWIASLSTCQ